MEILPGPIDETNLILQEEWPKKGKSAEKRYQSLRDSCDAFPMHLILIRSCLISRIYKEKIFPIAHVKVMEVAGRTDMLYVDDFLIEKTHRNQGYGRFFFDMVQQFMTEQLDADCFGMSTKNNSGGQSFFFHMGLNEQKERIPFIDVHDKSLLEKVNSFFAVAGHAMDRKSDVGRTWMSKELIHYHLFGKKDEWGERNEHRAEEKLKLEREVEEKKVGKDYKKTEADVTGHEGVHNMVRRLSTIDTDSEDMGPNSRKQSLRKESLARRQSDLGTIFA